MIMNAIGIRQLKTAIMFQKYCQLSIGNNLKTLSIDIELGGAMWINIERSVYMIPYLLLCY